MLTFSRRLVVERPTLLRLMKIVFPKRHFPLLRFSFTDVVASVVRLRFTFSLTLPLQGAPAGGLAVPRARTRPRLPMIFAVAPPLGKLNVPCAGLVIVMLLVASAVFPALSANVTFTV